MTHVVRATAGRIIFNRNIPQDLGFVKRLDEDGKPTDKFFDYEITETCGKKLRSSTYPPLICPARHISANRCPHMPISFRLRQPIFRPLKFFLKFSHCRPQEGFQYSMVRLNCSMVLNDYHRQQKILAGIIEPAVQLESLADFSAAAVSSRSRRHKQRGCAEILSVDKKSKCPSFTAANVLVPLKQA